VAVGSININLEGLLFVPNLFCGPLFVPNLFCGTLGVPSWHSWNACYFAFICFRTTENINLFLFTYLHFFSVMEEVNEII